MFIAIATVLFWLLFFMWRKDDFFNFAIKMLLFGMSGWGTFLVLQSMGYILKS